MFGLPSFKRWFESLESCIKTLNQGTIKAGSFWDTFDVHLNGRAFNDGIRLKR